MSLFIVCIVNMKANSRVRTGLPDAPRSTVRTTYAVCFEEV